MIYELKQYMLLITIVIMHILKLLEVYLYTLIRTEVCV